MSYVTTFNGRPREGARSLRCPNVNRLQRDSVVELHKRWSASRVCATALRIYQAWIDRSFQAIGESNRLLARLREAGL